MSTDSVALRDCAAVHGYVGRVCFKKGPPGRVGAELEWLVADAADPGLPVSSPALDQLLDHYGRTDGTSTLTLEPGGQVELSSPVADSLDVCWRSLRRDVDRLGVGLRQAGLAPLPTALEPVRPPRRILTSPRYDAMQEFFDAREPAGLLMMTQTAALQVNLDIGADAGDATERWRALHDLGPLLVATFANSPLHDGGPTGWKSTRHHYWQRLERTVAQESAALSDPVSAWAERVLDAPVMIVRDGRRWRAGPGFSFRDWVVGAAGGRPPTEDDLRYHLTTIFPPVRARGWFEVRYLDAQSAAWWPVPLAVLVALIEDPAARAVAPAATAPLRRGWRRAARHGLADPEFAVAARQLMATAVAALPRVGASVELTALVTEFAERYTERARCPADDALDEWHRSRLNGVASSSPVWPPSEPEGWLAGHRPTVERGIA